VQPYTTGDQREAVEASDPGFFGAYRGWVRDVGHQGVRWDLTEQPGLEVREGLAQFDIVGSDNVAHGLVCVVNTVECVAPFLDAQRNRSLRATTNGQGHIAAAALPPCTSSASFLTASRKVGTVNGSITRGPKPPRVSST
jgi:hypothetical protein